MNILEILLKIFQESGFAGLIADPRSLVMILLACFLLYLGIHKKYEPLLMIPIAFGMLLANLPRTGITEGLIHYLSLGVEYGIYPSLVFLGTGAMTDFGPLIANPSSLLMGAGAQFGIFTAFLMALALGFDPKVAAAIGVIGGADGPTAILTASKLAMDYLPAIAIAAYSYMALIPMIQPPLMRLMTTKKERETVMKQARTVTKTERVIFPIAVTIFVILLIPDTA
ncbi:MAG: sodium ion-translocating decarboxylase subunit beta, partial [Solobacterium sp.]|nr:sodium ion-translocating decarboxylase subunit beta [Solobacterium sp.]